MPVLTRASAADLTTSSVTLQAKRFQLFQPMGGVRAKPFSRARADGTQKKIPDSTNNAARSAFFIRAFIKTSRRIPITFSRGINNTNPHARKERALRTRRLEKTRAGRDATTPWRWRQQVLRRLPQSRR